MSSPSQQHSQQPIISSPAYESPSFSEGQPIAFIYNRTDLLPGIVKLINPDLTFDLEVYIPSQTSKISWKGQAGKSDFTRTPSITLTPTIFPKASPVDPRMQVIKVITPLSEVIEDASRGHKQTAISAWRDSGRRIRIPKLTDFHAPLVGHFFDPSLYFYRLVCWRAPMQISPRETLPEETRYFPNPSKQPYYKNFQKAFSRYVKEFYENMEKWHRVEMIAILPEDTQEAKDSKEAQKDSETKIEI